MIAQIFECVMTETGYMRTEQEIVCYYPQHTLTPAATPAGQTVEIIPYRQKMFVLFLRYRQNIHNLTLLL